MKNLMLIGKFNHITQFIHTALKRDFVVQLCSEKPDVVKGMLKMTRMDLIVISTSDMDAENGEVYDVINDMKYRIPVLSIGTAEELERYRSKMDKGRFTVIERPVKVNEIIDKIGELLQLEPKAANEEPQDTVKAEKKKKAPEKKAPRKGPKKRILLVDDSIIPLRTVQAMLREAYDVDLATSGLEALEIMRKRRPDLVFLDYDMPKFDGKDTLEMMQSDSALEDIPVVFLTGVQERQKIMAVLGLNPTDYLLKPVDKNKIEETIHRILGE